MDKARAGARHPRGMRLGAWLLGLGLVAASLVAAAPSLAASVAAPPYSDIANSPDATAITFLTAEGVLNGYPNGTFKPTQLITRAEFTKTVVALLGPRAQAAAQALANITPDFKDAKDIPTWAWGYVNYAQGNGLVEGYPNHTFEPNADITDVEAAAILIRAIGDTPMVKGTWPSNYTVAAYDLGLTQGVDFVTNLPATRGDVAQMAYNAVLFAPTLQSGYTSGTPSGPPLYMGGDGMQQLAWSGTVSAVTSSDISLNDSQGQAVLANAPLAASYDLLGASNVTTLLGAQVLVAENTQGQVDFIAVQKGVTQQSGTLANSTVPTPSGFTRVYDWLVQAGTQYSLLLSTGQTVPVVSTTSGAGTDYYVNPPSGGASLDSHSEVAGAQDLADGDSVNFVLNSAGQATAVYASGPTIVDGVVTSTDTTTNTLTVATGAQDSSSETVSVQPWTQVTLNGAASDLAALQPNDVVNIDVVGNGNGGDTNATLIAATRQTVSGTITALSVQSSATGTTTQITLTEANGSTVTVAEDPEFDSNGANLAVGQPATLVLDPAGQARLAEVSSPSVTVVLVEQLLTTETTSGTLNQIQANDAGQQVTYTLASGLAEPPQPPANGYLAEVTVQPGTTTVTSVQPLLAFQASGYTLKVLSTTAQGAVIQEVNAQGQPTSTAFYVAQSNGAVAYNGTTYVPFSQVPVGQVVNLWQAPSGQEFLGITY